MDARDALKEYRELLGPKTGYVALFPAAELGRRLMELRQSLAVSPVEVAAIDPVGLRVSPIRDVRKETEGILRVDISLAGPSTCPAVQLGADVTVDRLTWLLGSESPWAVVGASGRIAGAVRRALGDGVSAVDEQLSFEMKDITLLSRKMNDNAQVLAEELACHPRVSRTIYPGLAHDPSHEVATRTLRRGFGSSVECVVDGSAEETERAIREARRWEVAGEAAVKTSFRRARLKGPDPVALHVLCGTESPLAIVMAMERILSDS